MEGRTVYQQSGYGSLSYSGLERNQQYLRMCLYEALEGSGHGQAGGNNRTIEIRRFTGKKSVIPQLNANGEQITRW